MTTRFTQVATKSKVRPNPSPAPTKATNKRKRAYDGEGQRLDSSVTRPVAAKRKVAAPRSSGAAKTSLEDVIDLTAELPENVDGSPRKTKKVKPSKVNKSAGQEKRLKRFRDHAPLSYLERLDRAMSQRMFIIDRNRDGPENVETFQIAGTTGNIYSVVIDKLPSCTCPDNRRARNQCKHIIYVLVRVLKAPPNLQYQAAFISTELAEIFAGAPAPPRAELDSDDEKSGKRKPIEGDCPICVLEFEPEKEEIIWCRQGCGNNIHAECFKRWAASKPGKPVTCVYCRADWQGDEDAIKKLSTAGPVNEEGYVNVANELGLSGRRDYGSYHPHWVRRQLGGGW